MATKKTAKKAVKKAAAKKTAKKAPAKKAPAKKAAKKITAAPIAKKAVKKELTVRTSGFEKVSKTRSKTQIVSELATSTGLTKKEITNFFDNLASLMKYDLTKGPNSFQIPGLLKVLVVHKAAVPARKGINPFTGEETTFKAKPARNIVRSKPLKGLKDMVK